MDDAKVSYSIGKLTFCLLILCINRFGAQYFMQVAYKPLFWNYHFSYNYFRKRHLLQLREERWSIADQWPLEARFEFLIDICAMFGQT